MTEGQSCSIMKTDNLT